MGKQIIVTQNSILLYLITGLLLIILFALYFLYVNINSLKKDIKADLGQQKTIDQTIDQTIEQMVKEQDLDTIDEEVEQVVEDVTKESE